MDLNLVTGGMLAILATSVAAGWRYMQSWWLYISGYAIVRVNLDASAVDFIATWLSQNAQKSPFGIITVGSAVITKQSTLASEWHAYESLSGGGLYWLGWVPVRISNAQSNGGMTNSGREVSSTRCLSFIRGTLNYEDIVGKAFGYRNGQKLQSRFAVTKFMGVERKFSLDSVASSPPQVRHEAQGLVIHQPDWSGLRMITCNQSEVSGARSQHVLRVESLSLTDEQKILHSDFDRWRRSRQWYMDRRIPWKFGATLYGPPGTGKTTFIRAMAMEYELPVYVFYLSTMSSQELRAYWDKVKAAAPAIAVFEDIDAVFDGTKTIDETSGLTFDVVLQCLSGIEEVDGIATFVTTNYIEKVAPSLLRPGRAGRVAKFDVCDIARARAIADRVLVDLSTIHRERVASACVGRSADAVTHACVQIAEELQSRASTVVQSDLWYDNCLVESSVALYVNGAYCGDVEE